MNCFMMNRKKIAIITEADKKRLIYIKELIESYPDQHHTIKNLSAKAEINRNKLTYGFKKMTGMSIHQFLILTRMINAKKILLESEQPIKAIALLKGYSHAENFINAFKKFYGLSPSQFIKKNRNN